MGSGKTALTLALCRELRDRYEHRRRSPTTSTPRRTRSSSSRTRRSRPERILGVETGGCPHTAIREDASINLEAVDAARAGASATSTSSSIESGGDNLAATFSPGAVRPDALRDRRRRRRQDPAQGRAGHHALGPAHHQQDRPRADGGRLARGHGPRCAEDARGRPFVFTNLKTGHGLDIVALRHRARHGRDDERRTRAESAAGARWSRRVQMGARSFASHQLGSAMQHSPSAAGAGSKRPCPV